MLTIKRLIGAFLFFLFCVCPLAAQSPPTQQNIIKPVPKQERATTSSPTEIGQQYPKTTNQHNPPNKQITSTDKAKPTIDNSTSDISDNYQKENLEIQRKLSESTDVIARFTVLLVIFTAVLAGVAIWQGYHLKKSVNSLRNAERAYIFVKVRLRDDTIKTIPEKATENFCEYVVMHKGKTPAILMSVNVFAGVYKKDIPGITSNPARTIPPGTIIIGDIPDDMSFSAPFWITKEELELIDEFSARLVCMGLIQYEDIFGIPHETGFCWEYQSRVKDFDPADDHERNYRT